MRLDELSVKELVGAGLAGRRPIKVNEVILHQLLQGSWRQKLVKRVAWGVKLKMDSEGTMRRTKVTQGNTEEGY